MNYGFPRVPIIGAVLLTLSLSAAARADVVLDWNGIAVRTTTAPPPAAPVSPFAQARFMAIAQVAVFEAVNAIVGGHEPYTTSVTAPGGASVDAAAVTAAYRVLVTYFPAAAPALNADRAASLAAIPDGAAKAAGITVGESAAQALIHLRANDGAAVVDPYFPSTADAGDWRSTPTPAGAAPCTAGAFRQWGSLTPFAIGDPDDFVPPPPPALDSNRYAKDFNEVKAFGGATSTARSQERSDNARFYAASSPSQLLNEAARQLSLSRGDSLARNAWGLAVLNMAINDSLIVSFRTKYLYTLWRPVTAIQNADIDGNRKTDADSAFLPYITTPCFPSYPSNHASGTNGGLEVLRRLYGAGGHDLTLSNAALGMTRTYHTLKQIANDVDDARVLGGIHFRFDQEAGADLGRAVATEIYKHALPATHGPEE
jgi:hypothetical protein